MIGIFFSVRLLSVLLGHSVFSSPPQRPMTSDFEGFSITSLVSRGPWLGIESRTSRTRSQHYTTRLSRRRYYHGMIGMKHSNTNTVKFCFLDHSILRLSPKQLFCMVLGPAIETTCFVCPRGWSYWWNFTVPPITPIQITQIIVILFNYSMKINKYMLSHTHFCTIANIYNYISQVKMAMWVKMIQVWYGGN